MSLFQIIGTGAMELRGAIANNSATSILSATTTTGVLFVPWFQVNEHNGGTHNLTVDIHDGTNARFLGSDAGSTWNAKALTAKQAVLFTLGYVIPVGSSLRLTSSDASGYLHYHGVVLRTY